MKDWPWHRYALLALLILVLLFFLYFKPKNTQIKNIRGERIRIGEEVTRLRAKKNQLDKIEVELKTMTATLKELEIIIPQKKEINDILRRIQQLAFDSQLNIEKFMPKGEINKDFYSEWPISIEITGNYYNLATFFDRLSNFSRLFNIEDFSIKSLQVQSETSTLSANSTAKTYIFLEATSPQKENTQAPGNKK